MYPAQSPVINDAAWSLRDIRLASQPTLGSLLASTSGGRVARIDPRGRVDWAPGLTGASSAPPA